VVVISGFPKNRLKNDEENARGAAVFEQQKREATIYLLLRSTERASTKKDSFPNYYMLVKIVMCVEWPNNKLIVKQKSN
jgi:hypothetical protein